MIGILYQIGIKLFSLLFWIYSFTNSKAAKRRKGLKKQFDFQGSRNVLFHCASAGEFEQVYPIIKNLQKDLADTKVIVSFFSSSGIEWLEKKKVVIDKCYFPTDNPKSVRRFLQSVNPAAVVIVKNEFWFNFLSECHQKRIPVYHVATAFKANHFALRFDYFKNLLQKSRRIWTLDDQSFNIASVRLKNLMRSGDPRIDRIIEQSDKLRFPEELKSWKEKPIVIYASVHREDIPYIETSLKNKAFSHIIVPHDVDEKEIRYFIDSIESPTFRHSDFKNNSDAEKAIIIDCIGMLSSLYSGATYAYIGGGFGNGIHNILESAIFGNIIFIGPRNEHFPEARILKKQNAIIEIAKPSDLDNRISLLSDKDHKEMKTKMSTFFIQHKGASSKITNEILNYLS